MDDLVEFLKAQLDEDEKIAHAVDDNSPPWHGQWVVRGEAIKTYNGWTLLYRKAGDPSPFRPGLLRHIAHHDPARALLEVETKRQIIRDFENATLTLASAGSSGTPYDVMTGAVNTLKRTIRLLAADYSDRPGYKESWRP